MCLRARWLVVLSVALCDIPVVVEGQTASGGSLSGYVRDQQTGVLSGATVVALSGSTSVRRVAVTDRTGYYRLPSLPPAEYTVTTELDGFSKTAQDNVLVREGLNLTLDVTLSVGPISQVITVAADTPLLEWKTAATTVNIAGDMQRDLPLSSLRTWSDFLLLTPGVVTTQARFQTYSIHGTTHASGVFLVDGADATSVLQGSTLFSQLGSQTVADIQVKTSAVDAAAPLGLGTIVTIATLSGSERFRGALDVVYQPRAWNASNTPGGQDLTVAVNQPDASLGGPIRRGRAWFFASGRLARNETGVPRSDQQEAFLAALQPGFEPFANIWRGRFGFAKITGQLSTTQQVLATLSRDVLTLGGAQPNEAGRFRNVVVGGPGYYGRLSSAWNSALTTRVALGYNGKKQENRTLFADRTGVTVHERVFLSGGRLFGTGPIAALEASPFPGTDFDVHMWTATADATYYRPGWWGAHEWQVGVYLQQRRNRSVTQYNNGGAQLLEVALRDPANPSAGTIPFHRVIFDAREATTLHVDSRDHAIYVEDAWRMGPRMTLNAGVRLDWVKRTDRIGNVVTQDSVEVGPRLGATFMLTSSLRDAVRVSWGRVHETLSQNETSVATNVTGVRDLYDTAFDGSFSTVFVTPSRHAVANNLQIDRDRYHQQYADEVIAGYRRQLRGQLAVDVSVMRREYRDRPAVVETNGVYVDGAFAGYRSEDVGEIYQLTANRWNWPVSTAIQLQASKQSRELRVIAGYMREWSRLEGSWQPNDPASFIQPDAFPNRDGVGFVNGCTSASFCPDANSLTAGFGGGTWRSHVADAAVTYDGPWDLTLSTSYNFQTGPWSGPILTIQPGADPRFGPPTVTLSNGRVVSNPLATPLRLAYSSRGEGQFRLPPLHLWNGRVARHFDLRAGELQAGVSVFNITNNGADQALQFGANQQFSPFFRRGSTRQFPRAAQVSLQLSF